MIWGYRELNPRVLSQIEEDRLNHEVNQYRADDSDAVRRRPYKDKNALLRPPYLRDIETILHLPLYNRYNDKTQVFSFYKNDDISRRGYHVQLVSRIARNIGRLLGLNIDLIEAIALGHDIGHTPFGHAGERYLSELLHKETGRYFNHNVHSTRVLDVIHNRNLSLQTLDGILCHNGESEFMEYRPRKLSDFADFEARVEACYVEGKPAIDRLIPCTLEGCVVRISDIIAYIGKDRQDAVRAKLIDNDVKFTPMAIGTTNAQMINNLVVDIVENSYGKNYISLSEETFNCLKQAKNENNKKIYQNKTISQKYDESVKPMFGELYYKLLSDVKSKNEDSIIYRHHIADVDNSRKYYKAEKEYVDEEPNQIVVDYIASMTDDYFIELHQKLFPNSEYRIEYMSYFEGI